VRAGMVESAERWSWSSAAAHYGLVPPAAMLNMEPWRKRWTPPEWCRFLADGESDSQVGALRHCTHTGRPLGSAEFVAQLEQAMMRPLTPRKGGRPKKPASDSRQLSLSSVA
jgi:putative transposase